MMICRSCVVQKRYTPYRLGLSLKNIYRDKYYPEIISKNITIIVKDLYNKVSNFNSASNFFQEKEIEEKF